MVGFSIDLFSINEYASISFLAKPLREWILGTYYRCLAFVCSHLSHRTADHTSYYSSEWWPVLKKSVHIVFLFISLIVHQLHRNTVLQASFLCLSISIFVSIIKLFRHLLQSQKQFQPLFISHMTQAQWDKLLDQRDIDHFIETSSQLQLCNIFEKSADVP
jgi:hypothetical protein